VADDPTSIWEQERKPRPRRRLRPEPTSTPPPDPAPSPAEIAAAAIPADEARLSLQDASRRFKVSASTLGAWCRAGEVDAVKEGRRWMVTAASVSARKRAGSRKRSGPAGRSGPSADGSAMLVPRDAWDKLMDQLGNLHEAGQQLAEARERAAKAETEAGFLRERLGEMRSERDSLRKRLGEDPLPRPEDRSWLARLFRRG
jgi:hypothetical protein